MTSILALFVIPVVLVTAFFVIELLCGLRPLHARSAPIENFRAVVVVPAHDEEAVVGRTVTLLRSEASESFSVLVVADNCADGTADAARAAGAQVIVRDEPNRRGKGYALAAARDHLRAEPPDVVVVVDADCRIDRSSLDALANAAASSGRACQAVNLLSPDLMAPPMVQISTFAFVVKNLVRQRGLLRLAGRAHLTGTGMALPWSVFECANLGGSNIVEDLALGLDLAERSAPPRLVEQATIWSPAASQQGTLVQRQRWEGGFLRTAFRSAPRVFARSLSQGNVRGVCAALDLCIPPLTLLFVLNAAAFCVALLGLALGSPLWLAVIELGVGLMAVAALALVWLREGRAFVSGKTLVRLPLYVLWKMPMYLGLIRRGAPKEWLRSGR